MTTDKDKLFSELDALDEQTIRERLAQKVYGVKKIPLVQEWLHQLETSRSEATLERQEEREKEANDLAREAISSAREANEIARKASDSAREANLIASEALIEARLSAKSAREQARWAMWAAIIATIAIIIVAMTYIKTP